jgi:hypothetical protein
MQQLLHYIRTRRQGHSILITRKKSDVFKQGQLKHYLVRPHIYWHKACMRSLCTALLKMHAHSPHPLPNTPSKHTASW